MRASSAGRRGATFGRLALFPILLGLAACGGLPKAAGNNSGAGRDTPDAFALEARFSLRHEDRSYSGHLSWQHAGGSDEILLASPLGQGLAAIRANAGGATMTAGDGKSYSAETAELLTRQVLGYPLPLGNLADWVRGRGRINAPDAVDASGRPLQLLEDGWRIGYEYDSDDPQALPGRVSVERAGAFDLRLRIDEWNSPEEAREPPKEEVRR